LKPYYKPPKYKCEVCGELLYDTDRYKVKLYLRGPFSKVVFKELVVCRDCLMRIINDKELRKKFRVRYRKMRVLRLW